MALHASRFTTPNANVPGTAHRIVLDTAVTCVVPGRSDQTYRRSNGCDMPCLSAMCYNLTTSNWSSHMTRSEIGAYLIIDPGICHGQMTFKGTRIPVDTVLAYLGKGYSVEQILRSWPELTRPAIEEVIALAAESLQSRYSAQNLSLAPA